MLVLVHLKSVTLTGPLSGILGPLDGTRIYRALITTTHDTLPIAIISWYSRRTVCETRMKMFELGPEANIDHQAPLRMGRRSFISPTVGSDDLVQFPQVTIKSTGFYRRHVDVAIITVYEQTGFAQLVYGRDTLDNSRQK